MPSSSEHAPRRRGRFGSDLGDRARPRSGLALATAAAALILAFAEPAASAQSVADLVAKNLAARGGAERLKAVDALKITGRMKSMGLDLPLTIWRKRPNLVRQEMRLQDRAIVQAFDGERAWTVNPLAGSDEPQEIRGQPADMMREQADFDGPLVDYQQKGSAIEVEGPDTVEGAKAVVLKITLKSGRVQRLWLDADTGLEVKSASEVPQGPRTVRVETVLSDYRPEDGLVMPHRLRTFVDGQLQADVTIDRIEVSPRIDPAIFRMPGRGAGG
jgi:outer membrane lipoprotein-sorting protein